MASNSTGSLIKQDIDLSTFQPKPIDQNAFQIAVKAFQLLDQGAQTGQWDEFIDMLHEDLTWFGPVDDFQGLHQGKSSAADLFRHHAGVTRTHWELKNVIANGNEIGFECWTSGTIQNKSYGNQLMMLFVIEGNKIRHFREYAGYINGVGDFVGHGDPNDGESAYDYKKELTNIYFIHQDFVKKSFILLATTKQNDRPFSSNHIMQINFTDQRPSMLEGLCRCFPVKSGDSG